jgi:hypothetical protein
MSIISFSNSTPVKHHLVKNIDRMITELTPYMTTEEINKCIDLLSTISTSKWDINYSVEDSKTQLKILLHEDRYQEMVMLWSLDNQKLLTSFGTLKYKNKMDTKDKTLYDGLDPHDNPNDWEKIYV